MSRHDYRIFSEGRIGELKLPNRLVRSATWDPSVVFGGTMTPDVLGRYRALATGGVGMIITGGFNVVPEGLAHREGSAATYSYDDVAIDGLWKLPASVRKASPDCKIVAQLETGRLPGPSNVASPFAAEALEPLSAGEIGKVVELFVEGVIAMRDAGFDGVQLHGAHGGLLSQFLSPYTNRRTDAYGGSVENRVRLVGDIVTRARVAVGEYPILIKVNCTDYVQGGVDINSFPELASEIEGCGVDAIEVSGGMWDCLVQSEADLGFRPLPSPESHTGIGDPRKQSYFLEYAEMLNLSIPVILVGGNRDVERLEEIVRRGRVGFVALCRPLISEPNLPQRWMAGRDQSGTDCISCNSCLYWMYAPGKSEPADPICLFKHDKRLHRQAQQWLATWVEKHQVR